MYVFIHKHLKPTHIRIHAGCRATDFHLSVCLSACCLHTKRTKTNSRYTYTLKTHPHTHTRRLAGHGLPSQCMFIGVCMYMHTPNPHTHTYTQIAGQRTSETRPASITSSRPVFSRCSPRTTHCGGPHHAAHTLTAHTMTTTCVHLCQTALSAPRKHCFP